MSENDRNVQHVCVCKVALAGDQQQIVVRDAERPVAWGEIAILQDLHGNEAVEDVQPIGLMPFAGGFREKQRLASIYGFEAVDKVYPGRAPAIEQFAPGWPIDVSKIKRKAPPRDRKTILAPSDLTEQV